MDSRKVLFLDRDGTINIDKHYLYKPEEFEWTPGILDLCRAARETGYEIVVATNQSGIERGYYTEEQYSELTEYMKRLFAEKGIPLLGVLHCPWLEHEDRKPNPGLFLKARNLWNIDMSRSVSLGDKERDVEACIRAGVGRNYLLSPEKNGSRADAVVSSPADMIPFLTP